MYYLGGKNIFWGDRKILSRKKGAYKNLSDFGGGGIEIFSVHICVYDFTQ